jgi:PadR family transcriptional regulator PadR
MQELKKGSLAMLVLHLLRERPRYGLELCALVRERSDGALNFEDGAMYPLLHDLERRGLIAGSWQAATEDTSASATETGTASTARKGPRRRYYRLTPAGQEAWRASLAEWASFSRAIGRVLGDAHAGQAIG